MNGIEGKGTDKYTWGHTGEGLLKRSIVYCLLSSSEPSSCLLGILTVLDILTRLNIDLGFCSAKGVGGLVLPGHKAAWLSVWGKRDSVTWWTSVFMHAYHLAFILSSPPPLPPPPSCGALSPPGSFLYICCLSVCLFACKVRQLGFADLLVF